MGSQPSKKGIEYGNVFSTVQYRARKVLQPKTDEEVQQIVTEASKNGQTVRAIGSCHSSTPVIQTSGYLLDLSNLTAPEALPQPQQQPNSGEWWITVSAGRKLDNLVQYLAGLQFALPNQGHILRQTLAGAISTATHGTGIGYATSSDWVRVITLIDGTGTVQHLRHDEIDPIRQKLFHAACCSVGAVGIILYLTIQITPLYYLSVSTLPINDIKQVLDAVPTKLQMYDHYELFFSTYVSKIGYEWTYSRVDDDQGASTSVNSNGKNSLPLGDFGTALDRLPEPAAFDTLQKDLWTGEHLTDWLSYYRVRFASQKLNTVLPCYQALSPESGIFPYVEMEIAVPLSKCSSAVWDVLQQIPIQVGVQVMIRFAKADTQGWISPAFGRDTAFISLESPNLSFLTAKYSRCVGDLFQHIEHLLITQYQGRPHWGKFYFNTKLIRKHRAEELAKFAAARQQLDPKGVFRNQWTRDFLE